MYDNHPHNCDCEGCTNKLTLSDADLGGFIPISDSINAEYLKEVFEGTIQPGNVSKPVWNELYDNLANAISQGNGGKGIELVYGPDWIFNQHLQSHVATFAAFKNHANTVDMVKALIDDDGNMKSFATWKKEVAPLVGNYNSNWLQAEYQTAVASSRMAKKWQNFQRRKDTYPNLEYRTQQDARVREEHRPLDGIIRHIDDPFWNTHFPPNGWRCRCDAIQTDRKPNTLPNDLIMPDKDFQTNVGQTAEIFNPNHPYYEATQVNTHRVQMAAKKYYEERTRNQVIQYAEKHLVGRAINIDTMNFTLTLTTADVKSIVAADYPNKPLRNNLLYVLPEVLAEAELIKTFAGEGSIETWFIYRKTIDNVPTNFNIYKTTDGRFGLNSITHHAK